MGDRPVLSSLDKITDAAGALDDLAEALHRERKQGLLSDRGCLDALDAVREMRPLLDRVAELVLAEQQLTIDG